MFRHDILSECGRIHECHSIRTHKFCLNCRLLYNWNIQLSNNFWPYFKEIESFLFIKNGENFTFLIASKNKIRYLFGWLKYFRKLRTYQIGMHSIWLLGFSKINMNINIEIIISTLFWSNKKLFLARYFLCGLTPKSGHFLTTIQCTILTERESCIFIAMRSIKYTRLM